MTDPEILRERMMALATRARPESEAVPRIVVGLGRRRRRRRAALVAACATMLVVIVGGTFAVVLGADGARDSAPVATDGPPQSLRDVANSPRSWPHIFAGLKPAQPSPTVASSVRFPDGGARSVLEWQPTSLPYGSSDYLGIAIETSTADARSTCQAHVVAGTRCAARPGGAWVDRWKISGRRFTGYAPLHPDDATGLRPREVERVRGVSWYAADGRVVTVVLESHLSLDGLEAIASDSRWYS